MKRGDEVETARVVKPTDLGTSGLSMWDVETGVREGTQSTVVNIRFVPAPPRRVPQWRKILRALEQRPAMGYTRHELADLLNLPLASVCRAVGEKLLPGRLVEVSEVITRESKYHADNGVLFITPKGRAQLQVAA